MWNGNFHAVPCINDYASATLQCTKLEDLDLSSDALNASLCHILQVWDLCLTKRMDKLGSTCSSGDGGRKRGDGIPVAE